MSASPPRQCLLCGSDRPVRPAEFVQRLRQAAGPAVPVDWWECRDCLGWFAYPVPSVEVLQRNWGTVPYADPSCQPKIFDAKRHMIRKFLAGLAARVPPGKLLDVGCSTGLFMQEAKKAGWTVSGFDPNESALKIARQHGFDVRQGWSLADAGYADAQFDALTVIDVFYYSWNPLNDLRTFHRLVRPGGTLAMRITNKRLFLGIARRLTTGAGRDALLTKMLQDQFHAISLGSLGRALRKVGFDQVYFQSRATTVPFRSMSWKTLTAYFTADAIRLATFGRVNVSPGVIVYARKSASS
jgi:2-polyprenyl-3-methyl-5-hydroxy-6-metoxy-1,4-benzoquinol methylase